MDMGFFLVWLGLFLWRKDIRKEILIISLIFGILGPFGQVIYLEDWWSPLTVFGTKVSIEDFLFAFLVGGIASVIYEDIFKKRVKIRKVSKEIEKRRNINLVLFMVFGISLFLVFHYVFGLNTFYSSILLAISEILILYTQRRDLIIDSLVSGILLVLVSSLVYKITTLITPGWIDAFWHFKNTPYIIIWNLPIDDIVWYFLFGAGVGPLYEYWKEGKLIKKK